MTGRKILARALDTTLAPTLSKGPLTHGAINFRHSKGIYPFLCGKTIAIHKGSYLSYGFHGSRHRVVLRRRDDSLEVNFMIDGTVLSNAIAHEVTQPLTATMANAVAGLRWLMW